MCDGKETIWIPTWELEYREWMRKRPTAQGTYEVALRDEIKRLRIDARQGYPPGDWRESLRLGWSDLLAGRSSLSKAERHEAYQRWLGDDALKNRFTYMSTVRHDGKKYVFRFIRHGTFDPDSAEDQQERLLHRLLVLGIAAAMKIRSPHNPTCPAIVSPNPKTRRLMIAGILYTFRDFLYSPVGLRDTCTYGGLAGRFHLTRNEVRKSVRRVRMELPSDLLLLSYQ